jgi:hypothetical protein
MAYPRRVSRERLPRDIEEVDDVVDKRTCGQIFDTLPRDERAKWLEYGGLLVERHAPRGKPAKVKQ